MFLNTDIAAKNEYIRQNDQISKRNSEFSEEEKSNKITHSWQELQWIITFILQ